MLSFKSIIIPCTNYFDILLYLSNNDFRETEERAQKMEERAIAAETQLKEALERNRALERSLRRGSQDSTSLRRYSDAASLPETNNDKASQ